MPIISATMAAFALTCAWVEPPASHPAPPGAASSPGPIVGPEVSPIAPASVPPGTSVAEPVPSSTTGQPPQPDPAAPPPIVRVEDRPTPPATPPGTLPPPPMVDRPTGLGLLIAGPLVVSVGGPLLLLANDAWRRNCGPTSSTSRCARGSMLSISAQVLSLGAFAGGIAMTAAGAKRRGVYDAMEDRLRGASRHHSGLLVAGAVTLSLSVAGMGIARLLLWIPTPECQTVECVRSYQRASTLTVSGLAVAATAGAGMLAYAQGYRRATTRGARLSLSPVLARGYGGLGLNGWF